MQVESTCERPATSIRGTPSTLKVEHVRSTPAFSSLMLQSIRADTAKCTSSNLTRDANTVRSALRQGDFYVRGVECTQLRTTKALPATPAKAARQTDRRLAERTDPSTRSPRPRRSQGGCPRLLEMRGRRQRRLRHDGLLPTPPVEVHHPRLDGALRTVARARCDDSSGVGLLGAQSMLLQTEVAGPRSPQQALSPPRRAEHNYHGSHADCRDLVSHLSRAP